MLASVPASNRPLVAAQPGFADAANRSGREMASVEKQVEVVPAYTWFNGPWQRIRTWAKGLGLGVSVDAEGRDVTHYENHHTPSL